MVRGAPLGKGSQGLKITDGSIEWDAEQWRKSVQSEVPSGFCLRVHVYVAASCRAGIRVIAPRGNYFAIISGVYIGEAVM